MLSVKPTLLTTLLFIFVAMQTQANDRQVDKVIAETAEQVSPLMNGQQIPSTMQVTTIEGEKTSLGQVLKNQKTILFFYRGGWCPFCNTQMGQLKKIEKELIKLGFQLIGISTDSPEDLQKSISKHQFSYQLLADFNSNLSQAFGLAYYASQKTTDKYLSAMNLKNPLQKNVAGNMRLVLPVPAIYIIDRKGLVQFNYVNPNYKVRLHEELLLKAASLVK
jgi:peroxiredoxin